MTTLVSAAHAEENPAIAGAQEAAGLFSHTCLLYPLRKEEMRLRLKETEMPELSAQARASLMGGRLGVGFDASNERDRIALISYDNDVCTVIAENADSKELIRVLEKNLKTIKSTIDADYVMTDAHEDEKDTSLHHRDYLITIRTVPFDMVVSTSDEPNRIQAFMTIAPHTPYNQAMPAESGNLR